MISIIVPIYKVEAYLPRCIESLINQDYKEIEIILVEDGSPDNCAQICDRYAKKDTRIKVIHKANGGLSSARNAGLDVTVGEYIMFVDSDDYVAPNFCSYALNKAQSTDSDIVVFGHKELYPSYSVAVNIEPTQEIKLAKLDALLVLINGRINSYAWNKIYRSSLFENIRYPVGRLYEDIGTTYLLFDKAKSIFISSKITYYYQQRDDSILGKKMTAKDAIDWYDMVKQRHEYIASKYPKIVSQIANSDVLSTMYCLTNLYCFLGYKQKKQEMEQFVIDLSVYPIHSKSLYIRLLLFSPMFFRMLQSLKRQIKKYTFFLKKGIS